MAIGLESLTERTSEMQALFGDIEVAATDAYIAVASDPERHITPDEVHDSNKCGPVTDYMIPALRERGYDVPTDKGERHMTYVDRLYDEAGRPLPIGEQPERSAVIHRFPVINIDDMPKNEVIADATWQQFLRPKQRSADLPKVLVGTRQDVQAQLQSFGFTDPNLFRIWERPLQPNKRKPHTV